MRKRVLLLLILVLITMMPTYAFAPTNPTDELELEDTLLADATKLKEIVEQLQLNGAGDTSMTYPEHIVTGSDNADILEIASQLEGIIKSLNLIKVGKATFIIHTLN